MNKTMIEEIQRKLQSEVDGYKGLQKELQNNVTTRQTLDAQLNENRTVKEELDLLKSESLVYKSVGPVLIKTDLVEAKQNVSKRLDFIGKEMANLDHKIVLIEKKQDTQREKIQKLQTEMQAKIGA